MNKYLNNRLDQVEAEQQRQHAEVKQLVDIVGSGNVTLPNPPKPSILCKVSEVDEDEFAQTVWFLERLY